VPDDEVPIPLRKYVYADGDNNNPIPDDGGDSITGEIVKPKKTIPLPRPFMMSTSGAHRYSRTRRLNCRRVAFFN
jgi:hypothetical protein